MPPQDSLLDSDRSHRALRPVRVHARQHCRTLYILSRRNQYYIQASFEWSSRSRWKHQVNAFFGRMLALFLGIRDPTQGIAKVAHSFHLNIGVRDFSTMYDGSDSRGRCFGTPQASLRRVEEKARVYTVETIPPPKRQYFLPHHSRTAFCILTWLYIAECLRRSLKSLGDVCPDFSSQRWWKIRCMATLSVWILPSFRVLLQKAQESTGLARCLAYMQLANLASQYQPRDAVMMKKSITVVSSIQAIMLEIQKDLGLREAVYIDQPSFVQASQRRV
ncbi:uncharacterized protein M437DRAFT_64995 [Aureobasidium melanogenum CBS 110374]|uniref:Uncharacterized protein n=1 Tax=Aureobasidium melanogenum (strain CBS 110374) TaxID=1043003 RepID=A0A074VVG2_AURM1|nr:uncharacterized protein M437DRAFT_64995 [Aureobasidium melanogenum CBS 110374]KEQ64458.1 hypothetical protein M437DRAFT_64995 [Aureobasidium melanogenum CBS 110374]